MNYVNDIRQFHRMIRLAYDMKKEEIFYETFDICDKRGYLAI